MIAGFTALLVFQLVGELIAQVFRLPVPGPVIGMALLFFALLARGQVPQRLDASARGVLSHLSLLFVPAGVGVMVHASRIVDEWPAIVLALVGSTLLSLGVTGWVVSRLQRTGQPEA
jgi:holin-like protein